MIFTFLIQLWNERSDHGPLDLAFIQNIRSTKCIQRSRQEQFRAQDRASSSAFFCILISSFFRFCNFFFGYAQAFSCMHYDRILQKTTLKRNHIFTWIAFHTKSTKSLSQTYERIKLESSETVYHTAYMFIYFYEFSFVDVLLLDVDFSSIVCVHFIHCACCCM